jgi:hypothetical protein
MSIKILSIKIKVENQSRSYNELLVEVKDAAADIGGFVEVSDLEVSEPIGQDTLDDVEERELTENQKRFVEDALAEGLEVDYDYSGRGMYGKTCPAVRVDRYETFATRASYSTDAMGMGKVYYARS